MIGHADRCRTAGRGPSPRNATASAAVAILCALAASPAWAGATFDRLKAQGSFKCGVVRQAGVAIGDVDATGQWRGFFPDFCRVVAAALTGDPDRVEYVLVAARNRMKVLHDREADVVMQNATLTLTREAVEQVSFPAIYYYDGQGFMGHVGLRARNLAELRSAGKAKACVLTSTTTEMGLRELVATTHPNVEILPVDTQDGYFTSFALRQCDIVSHDRLFLSAHSRRKDLGEVVVFPDVISKEPLGPMVRADDRAWELLVRWAVHATIQAEELGLTSANVAARRASDKSPPVQRLLGGIPGLGAALGVADDWALRIIETSGNYGEIYDRNLGAGSDLKVERGLNQLWTKGGLLYAPPMR
ncbi:MAG: transporter substrate-binding domain-containing protein [Alphaproteobacteria bacterium]|nr:transporter substrate-binding domain-containing protein [Alphaproteobacteria bacterium]